jgi:acetyl esterase/lipase
VEFRRYVLYWAGDRKEKLDLYLPTGRGTEVRSPGVVIIHGGGWVGGDKGAGREINIGTTLARAGYACVSVNYMMEEGKRWPMGLQDCKNAVKFLRVHAEEYQVDPQHIGVIGGSAGGHLALMVAYTPNHPDISPKRPYETSDSVNCVVDLYGITDLLTRRKTEKDGTPVGEPSKTSALLTKSADEDPALWKLASPVYHVTKQTVPTLILHGTADTTVDRDQATELAAKLKEAGVEHQLVMVPGVGHTFDLETWKKKPLPIDVKTMVVEFFDRHLKPTR